MGNELRGPDVWFRYRAIDIRDLDGDRLLESNEARDHVIAIWHEAALGQLLVLAGLRHFEETAEREARKMPLLNDILDNKGLAGRLPADLEDLSVHVLDAPSIEDLLK